MKTTLMLSLCVSLSLSVGMAARAQGTRTEGKVLVLKNEHAISGVIRREGNQYRIERKGGELLLPADKALHLCVGWEDALGFMRSRANLQDPDERVRLAKWCHLHGLNQFAVEEAKAALQMQPRNSRAMQLLKIAERTIEQNNSPEANSKAKKPGRPTLTHIDLDSESMTLFVTKIQPILMNTCVRCHCGDKGGSFRLQRNYGLGNSGQRATQYNMALVMQQIHAGKPELSPLLIKAQSRHHQTVLQSPLKRDSVAYQTLESWVHGSLQRNPHLRTKLAKNPASESTNIQQAFFATTKQPSAPAPVAVPTTVPLPMPSATNPPRKLPPLTAVPLPGTNDPVNLPPSNQFGTDKRLSPIRPASLQVPANPNLKANEPRNVFRVGNPKQTTNTNPVDEFDPQIFNRLNR